MKIYKTISLLLIFSSFASYSQELNWRTINDNTKHLVSVNFGADYSSYYGVSYGYHIKNSFTPLIIGTEFNLSFGNNVFDDWKSRTSIHTELWHSRNLSWGLKGGFIMRHFVSDIARLFNLGADLTTTFGYASSTWGIVGTINYDRAIATQIKNDLLKEFYPAIQDGWYNSSGGNFKFGIRASRAFNTWNTYLHIGKTFGQDFQDNPTLPFYAELSLQKQF
jgi:hypothetical protein